MGAQGGLGTGQAQAAHAAEGSRGCQQHTLPSVAGAPVLIWLAGSPTASFTSASLSPRLPEAAAAKTGRGHRCRRCSCTAAPHRPSTGLAGSLQAACHRTVAACKLLQGKCLHTHQCTVTYLGAACGLGALQSFWAPSLLSSGPFRDALERPMHCMLDSASQPPRWWKASVKRCLAPLSLHQTRGAFCSIHALTHQKIPPG